jgi:hypothetical protein
MGNLPIIPLGHLATYHWPVKGARLHHTQMTIPPVLQQAPQQPARKTELARRTSPIRANVVTQPRQIESLLSSPQMSRLSGHITPM